MALLQGTVALVTGSFRGIGKSIVERLARDGAIVVVNYARSRDKALEVAKTIEETGGRALAIQADVADVTDYAGFSERSWNASAN
jgi:3-oxoacyl-[acyl-carrier protein] reductase